MNRRKEERYARAMARLTVQPGRRAATEAKVAKLIAASPNKNLPQNFASDYTNHKLGIRRERK